MSTIVKLWLCLSLGISSVIGQELQWPEMMHTSESINKTVFRGLRNYFEKLSNSAAVEWRGENRLVVYEGRQIVFRAYLEELRPDSDSCVSYVANFVGRNRQSRRVFVNTCPSPEKNHTLKELLNGSFLKGALDYQVEFSGWDLSIVGRMTKRGKQTVYESNQGAIRIILNEQETESRLYSELFYRCATCDGDALVAVLEKNARGVSQMFYGGLDGHPIDSRSFYHTSAGYLDYPLNFMNIMIDDAIYFAGWPSLR